MVFLCLPACFDICSFFRESKLTHFLCAVGKKKALATIIGGPLHSPHNRVTWIYDPAGRPSVKGNL